MASSEKKTPAKLTTRGIQAIKSLSAQFITYMVEEGLDGQTFEKIIATFTRHQAKIISGVLSGVGIAGGAWAAISLWTSSLGLWGSLGYALGLVTMPAWVPVAGGVAGLTAAGGAIYGVLNLTRSRKHSHKLQVIVGFSKMLIGKEELEPKEEAQLRKILLQQKVDGKRIDELLHTTVAEAKKLAGTLSADVALEVARYLFPLVYAEQGVISSTSRGRFARICSALNLPGGQATEISAAYRNRLDTQWNYLENIVGRLNYFAGTLGLDLPEMELLREQLAQLMRFDPRRIGEDRRERCLKMLTGRERDVDTHLVEGEVLTEAALMGAYALAQTVCPETESRRQLEEAFAQLVEGNAELSDVYRKKLLASRKKVDDLYSLTRTRILAAEKERKEKKK